METDTDALLEFELDRRKGFLTAADIRWLIKGNEEGFSAETMRQKRQRVRNRTRNAIHDFQLLFQYLPEEEVAQIFDLPDDFEEQRRSDMELDRFLAGARGSNGDPLRRSWT